MQSISKTHCLRRGSSQHWIIQLYECTQAFSNADCIHSCWLVVIFRYIGTGMSWNVNSLQMAVSAQHRAVGKTPLWYSEQLSHCVALGHVREGKMWAERHLQLLFCCFPDGPRPISGAGQISVNNLSDCETFPVWRVWGGQHVGEVQGALAGLKFLASQHRWTVHAILKTSRTANNCWKSTDISLFNRNTELKSTIWVLS